MFRRKSKAQKVGLLILALTVAFAFSGCGKSNEDSGPDSLLNASSESKHQEDFSSEEEGIEFEAALSYANADYIDTGDESEEKLIRNVKQTLTAADTDEKLQIEAVLEALKTVPDDLDDAETFVGDAFTVNFLKFSGSSLVLDLSSDGLGDLGSYDEEFFVYQVTDSILNTFPDLEGVRFTVDGSNTDSLNYVDISSPFTASEVKEFLKGKEETETESSEENTSSAAKKSDSSSSQKEKTTASKEEDDRDDEDTQSEDSGSSKSSKKSESSSSSAEKQTSSDSSSTGSKSTGKSTGKSSGNKSSTSGKGKATSGGSTSGKNTTPSGNQSDTSGENDNSDDTVGISDDTELTSGGGTSSGTQDGVVNDSDL